MRRGAALAGIAAGVATVAAGCGDGDRGDSLGKAEYLERGNRICREGNAEIEAAFARFERPPTRAQAEATIAEAVVPAIQRQIDALQVGVPEADTETIEAIAREAEAVLDRVRDDPSHLFAVERRGGDPFARTNRKLRDYGLRACAEG